MRNVLLLIFTQADLDALPNALRWLRSLNTVQKLMVLHNPDIGITDAEVTREIDGKIRDLEKQESTAATLKDYTGAAKLKEQIDALKVERGMAVRDAWKAIPDAARKAAYAKAMGDLGTEPVQLIESYADDQVFKMLNGFLFQWPADIPMGEFAVLFPRAVGRVSAAVSETARDSSPVSAISATEIDPQKNWIPNLNPRERREAELRKSRNFGIKSAAKKAGVWKTGMTAMECLDAVLAKEFPEQAAA